MKIFKLSNIFEHTKNSNKVLIYLIFIQKYTFNRGCVKTDQLQRALQELRRKIE